MSIEEESRLLKKIITCVTRKCGKYNKEISKTRKLLIKEQDKECPQKASNCLDKVYAKSKFSKVIRKHVTCSMKKCKCSKETRTIKKLRKMREKI